MNGSGSPFDVTGGRDPDDGGAAPPRLDGLTDPVLVGRGAAGTIWRARQEQFSRDVAVKVIEQTVDSVAAQRFARECQAVGGLSGHPYVVTVYAAGVLTDGRPYLTMPFLPGGSLADAVAIRGPLPWEEVLDVGVKISSALHAAHAAGVLHRDIKPENILLSAYDEPLLADFGIARLEQAALTRTGMMVATPMHAAPEIMAGKPASAASDVYGLGSSLFRLVAGKAAFFDPNDESLLPLLARIVNDPPPDLRPMGAPDPVAAALERSMAKDPAGRPASALELGRALQDAQREAGVAVTRAPSLGTSSAGVGVAVPTQPVRRVPTGPPLPLPPLPGSPGAADAEQPWLTGAAASAASPPAVRDEPLQPWQVEQQRVAATRTDPRATPLQPGPPYPSGPPYPPSPPARRRGGLLAALIGAGLLVLGGGGAALVLAGGDSGAGPTPLPSASPSATPSPRPSATPSVVRSSSPSTSPSAEASSPQPTPSASGVGLRNDQRTAEAALLTAGDLPAGWMGGTYSEDADRVTAAGSFADCVKVDDVTADETGFAGALLEPADGGTQQIVSEVTVFGDPLSVPTLLMSVLSPDFASCIESENGPRLQKQLDSGTVGGLTTELATPPTAAGDIPAVAWRTMIKISDAGVEVTLLDEHVVLAGDRTVISLDFVAVEGSPIDKATKDAAVAAAAAALR